jgi:hypothetical protein
MSARRPASGEVRLPHQHLPPAGLYQGSSAPSGTGAGLRGVDPKPDPNIHICGSVPLKYGYGFRRNQSEKCHFVKICSLFVGWRLLGSIKVLH